ncbi:MAG: AzlD domain-containing protein [Spirochaetales bacterium]|nr:AzlD domain-containing protein [Spirochaetales bacterium]
MPELRPELMAVLWIVVSGSALATFLPRFLPFFMGWIAGLKGRARLFLRIMPVAALGALIFPGVIQTFPDRPWAGLCGIAVAAVAAWFLRGLIFPVLISIAAVFIMQLF